MKGNFTEVLQAVFKQLPEHQEVSFNSFIMMK